MPQATLEDRVTLESLFAEAGFTPNENQARAIHHVSGPLFLVAGPGSGKTRVLLWRTLNLIVFHGVRPDEIFLSTFTEKAAKQLKDGLLSLLGLVTNRTGIPYDLSKMYVGTVHSLCNRMLTDRTFSPDRNRRNTPSVMDALEQFFTLHHKSFWREAQEALGLEDDLAKINAEVNHFFSPKQYEQSSRHQATQNIQGVFNRFSEENLDPEVVIANHPDEMVRKLGQMYALYRKKLGNATDLSLLQQAAYRSIKESLDSGLVFKHVIVDEYQDTNAIQELIYFALAGHGNICVVGDDEQALYRFRGATVENFVQFPERCQQHLGLGPTRIELNTNYRSQSEVVRFYTRFMEQINWQRPHGGAYRIEGKDIRAHSQDSSAAVVASSNVGPDQMTEEIADLVVELKRQGKVKDYNQIAFLFPSLKGVAVGRFEQALNDRGVKVYAPRAKRFLEAEEPTVLVGLMLEVIGKPDRNLEYDAGSYKEFHDWLDAAREAAKKVKKEDKRLAGFIKDRQDEIATSIKDHAALAKVMEANGWSPKDRYSTETHKRALLSATGLSDKARRTLAASHLEKLAADKARTGQPFTLHYAVNRATSLDWSVLDLYYRFLGFDHFKAMFDLAESGLDEGPICNLSLVSKLISRFLDQTQTVLTASFLRESRLTNIFVGSYLFALFRLAEGEYEDAEDPFPKGRVPFLTVHQSKGLEFPVVIVGNAGKLPGTAQRTEEIVRPLLKGDPEPLDRVSEFDTMRMYYVALSRAQNLMVIAHPKGSGQRLNAAFKPLLEQIRRIPELDVTSVPEAKLEASDVSRSYSYTGDYLNFLDCPRRYMIFRKYEFASSRTQAMFFGNLVHQTIEDLHNRLIADRNAQTDPNQGTDTNQGAA